MLLDTYRALGRSGLRVCPLALGTMTFGRSDWGCDAKTAAAILDAYLDAGGNFVDTADMYSGGASEELLATLIAERGVRDRVVLSTKFTLAPRGDNDPNGAGNGRKSMLRAVEGSLRRLRTDYVDLYYLHAWDAITYPEEVMRGLDDLVSQGKVRYIGLSDVPAWYAARAQTIAEWRGFEPVCAVQLEYSLLERGIEYEFPDLARQLGIGIVTWSPLSNGLLSGKYSAPTDGREGALGRVRTTAAHMPPVLDKQGERTWAIVALLRGVAEQLGRSPAQVAVNWVANRPGVDAVTLGATSPQQLADTLSSLDFEVPTDLIEQLTDASAPPPAAPYAMVGWQQGIINRGVTRDRQRPTNG